MVVGWVGRVYMSMNNRGTLPCSGHSAKLVSPVGTRLAFGAHDASTPFHPPATITAGRAEDVSACVCLYGYGNVLELQAKRAERWTTSKQTCHSAAVRYSI